MNGLFGQDMQTMYPHGAAPQSWQNTPQAPMPGITETELPRYVGNPIVDKYMHMFIGDQNAIG